MFEKIEDKENNFFHKYPTILQDIYLGGKVEENKTNDKETKHNSDKYTVYNLIMFIILYVISIVLIGPFFSLIFFFLLLPLDFYLYEEHAYNKTKKENDDKTIDLVELRKKRNTGPDTIDKLFNNDTTE